VSDRRPSPGPITILPKPTEFFTEAVEAAGGTVVPLSDETRAIVWVANHSPEILEAALADYPAIQWVQLPWAGVDAFAKVLSKHAGDEWPLWTSAKGAYSEPVAEQAFGLAVALLREYPQRALSTSWAMKQTGTSLYGKNVTIVGAGGIALELIRLLSVFDVNITVVRRSSEPLAGVHTTTDLDGALGDADVVVIAAASTTSTAKLFAARQFELMKPSAVLVNIARGALIDQDALVTALSDGQIAGAGLDVTSPEPLPDGHPLWRLPNCVITSHSADTPAMTLPLLASRVRTNVAAFLGDGRFVGVVDPGAGY
jgi:phosphoglycerate dehydrogenase-like enzyme